MAESPLLKRTNAQRLTKELLDQHIHAVKDGFIASETLLNEETVAELTLKEKNALLIIKRKGSEAQQKLIISALPLIKNIASREFKRRKGWSSRVDFDDILQEAIAGFIRGLKSYKPESNHENPSNYLGQWIQTSIRRKIETLEHDFSIPYEVVERARRIRAVKSRLINEMQQEPTDLQLLEALNGATGQYGNSRWGGKTQTTPRKKNIFTESHLREAEELQSRSYSLAQHDSNYDDSEERTEREATPLTATEESNSYSIDEAHVNSSRHEFFRTAFITMKIGSKQQDIILRYFGMKPYSDVQSQKDIVKETGYPVRFVKLVILEFQSYMATPGGVFHLLLTETSPEIIESLELDWILPHLGDYPSSQAQPSQAPAILIQTTLKTSRI